MKKWISYITMLIIVPAVVIGGACIFREKQYAWITLCVALLSCVPFIINFERKEHEPKKLILIAIMVALSVVGRLLFAVIPGFKPVTAFTVITAIYFGSEAGFMTGALAAVISNFYFGQGPWTPFQMLAWGILGLIAGLIAEPLKKSKIVLCLYGAGAGILFSLITDIWTVLWYDGYFNFPRYFAATVSALPSTVTYMVSNIIFLLLFIKPFGKILERIKVKYGI